MKNIDNDVALYRFIQNKIDSLENGYNQLGDIVKKFYPEHATLVENYTLQQRFEKFEQWFDKLTRKEAFNGTTAIISIPYMHSGKITLNINLSSWWSKEDSDWAAADECILEFFDPMYKGIEKLCMEERWIGNYFSIALAALFMKEYIKRNGKNILSASGEKKVYFAISNFGETVTFAKI